MDEDGRDELGSLDEKEIRSAFLDGQRKIRTQDLGASAQPKRDLQTSKWAAPLREVPWKARLAYLMAMEATSGDVGTGWNEGKLAERLQSPVDLTWLAMVATTDQDLAGAGIVVPKKRTTSRADRKVARETLMEAFSGRPDPRDRVASLFPPPDADIAQCIVEVSHLLEGSNPNWFDKNIARPMGVRASSSLVGSTSIETLAFSSGEFSGEATREDSDTALAGDRLGRDHWDTLDRSLATLDVDLHNARDLMQEERQRLSGGVLPASPGDAGPDGPGYRRAVLDAAIRAIDALIAASPDSTALRHSIELVYDTPRTSHAEAGAVSSTLIINAANATAPQLMARGLGQGYCDDVTTEIAEAIAAIARPRSSMRARPIRTVGGPATAAAPPAAQAQNQQSEDGC